MRLLVLAAATLALRLPFALVTQRLAHWDAINYALALHDFNIAAHQPHPPGSPYFVLLGRAAFWLTGDENTALLSVTLLASVAAVCAEYALVRMLFGPRAALLAGLMLTTQPVFWGYGTIATAWTMLAFLAILVAMLCWNLQHGRPRLLIPSAIVLGSASGFRLDVTVFLAPLWLWSVFTTEPGWRRRVVAISVALAGVLLWLVPVVIGAGGLESWTLRLLALLPTGATEPSTRVRQLAANTVISFGTLAFTIGPSLLVGLALDARGSVKWLRSSLTPFWMLWIGPAFVFLWLVDSTEPGHALIFVPALVAIGSGLLVHLAPAARRVAVSPVALVGAQVAVFVTAAPVYGFPLAWTADSMLLNVTAPGIRLEQSSLDWTLRSIRSHYDPHDSVIVTLVGQDPYRFMMYYLPEFVVLQVDPSNSSVLVAQNRMQGNWIDNSDCLFANFIELGAEHAGVARVRHSLWVLSRTSEPGSIPEGAQPVSDAGADHPLWDIWDVQTGFRLGPGLCGQ